MSRRSRARPVITVDAVPDARIHLREKEGRWNVVINIFAWHRGKQHSFQGWCPHRDRYRHASKEEALACAEQTLPELRCKATEKWARSRRAGPQRRAARLGPGWAKLRLAVLSDEPTCRLCGDDAAEVDHILPLWWGGTSELDNLQPLCTTCHQKKSLQEMQSRRRSEPKRRQDASLVHVGQIAQRLRVQPETVSRWVSKGIFPPPESSTGSIGRRWKWPIIQAWAQETGRHIVCGRFGCQEKATGGDLCASHNTEYALNVARSIPPRH